MEILNLVIYLENITEDYALIHISVQKYHDLALSIPPPPSPKSSFGSRGASSHAITHSTFSLILSSKRLN